jgi:hypothetical protein
MNLYLLDGPLMTTCERRTALLARMTKALVESGQHLASDRDAVRVLMTKGGFHNLEVAILAGEARMLAYQEIVAVEMMKP